MQRPFAKYEGLGNDFIVLDARDWPLDDVTPALARAFCERHVGIGGDGVLWLGADGRLVIFNADGSRPEMCGNGVRCIAGFLHDVGRLATGASLQLSTDAGPRTVTLVSDDGNGSVTVDVDMGPVRVGADDVLLDGVRAVPVDVGNPHAVLFESLAADAEPRAIRAAEANESVWPNGVNVEFVRARGDGGFAVRVHERGVGWTKACGTGACAVAAAAVVRERGARLGEAVSVELPGGVLRVVIEARDGGMRARMSGPASRMFTGQIQVTGERARA
jgi:diaminopimelate epimerase